MASSKVIPNKLEGNVNFWFILSLLGIVSAFHFGITSERNSVTEFVVQQFTQTSAFAKALSAVSALRKKSGKIQKNFQPDENGKKEVDF